MYTKRHAINHKKGEYEHNAPICLFWVKCRKKTFRFIVHQNKIYDLAKIQTNREKKSDDHFGMNWDLPKKNNPPPLSHPINENVHKSAYHILQRSCSKFYKIFWAVIYWMGELKL